MSSWLSDRAVDRLRAAASRPVLEGTRYTIIAEIGRGGMGAVYRARDEALDREVAIKVSSAVDHRELDTRFRGEARILARLEHPGIVPVHDVGQLGDGRPFYVMKLVRGKTLLEHVGRTSDRAERLRIFERICEPVAFAHAHGLVHRDLKPSNVMIGAFGEVLVLDWGVAKSLAPGTGSEAATELTPPPAPDAADGTEPGTQLGTERRTELGTEPGTMLGTRGYMSPEQARGSAAETDQRSDVYSLGAILFTLLTGDAPPATPQAPSGWFSGRPEGVPRPLQAISLKALAADPADRYQTATALAGDVARFSRGEAVSAYRESPIERVWRIAYRYRAAILLVAAYLIMRAIIALAVRR